MLGGTQDAVVMLWNGMDFLNALLFGDIVGKLRFVRVTPNVFRFLLSTIRDDLFAHTHISGEITCYSSKANKLFLLYISSFTHTSVNTTDERRRVKLNVAIAHGPLPFPGFIRCPGPLESGRRS